MATHSPISLARKINALLDGPAFFDLWKETFRDPHQLGANIKTFCPFHPGETYRAFLLDLRAKTFRCTVKTCKAAAGGGFADLHVLLTDKEPLEALLDVSTTFRLSLPADLQHEMAEALAELARDRLQAAQVKAAENLARLAVEQEPANPVFRRLLADICDSIQQPDQARPHHEHALELALGEKDWHRAAAVLGHLRAVYPDEPAYLERSVEVARAQCDLPKAATECLELGRHPGVEPEKQRQWLEQARSLDPVCPEILERLATVCEQTAHTGRAVEVRQSLVEFYHLGGQWQKALDALDEVARLCPGRDDVTEKRATLLMAAGRTDEAAALLRILADRAEESGQVNRCEQYLLRLGGACPTDVEPCRRLLALLEQAGRIEEAARMADRLLAVCDPATAGARYAAVLEQLVRWYPENPVYCGRLIAHYANRGDGEAAVRCLRDSVTWCFGQDRKADALRHIEVMRGLVVDHPRQRLEMGRLLAAHDCRAEALRECESVARECLADNEALAEEACIQGLELDPSHAALSETLFQIRLAKHPEGALDHGLRMVERYRTQGAVEKALAVLERLRQRLPAAIPPRLLLARLAAETGQPERAVAEIRNVAARDLTIEQATEAVQVALALMERHGRRADLQPVLARLHRLRHDDDALIETLLTTAAAQRASGAANAAEATYAEVLVIRPDELRALLGRAELAFARQGFGETRPVLLHSMARMRAAGRSDDALTVGSQCLKWAPDDVDCRRQMAELLAGEGRLDEACEHWQAAAASYLMVRGNPAAAAECYEAVLRLRPGDAQALEKSEQIRAQVARERAEQEAREAQAPAELAASAPEVSDADQAAQLFSRALETDPDNPDVREAWALFLYDHNRIDEGHQVLVDLAELLLRLGKNRKAIELLTQTLDRFPRAAVLYAQLGGLYQAGRAMGRAAASYKKALELFDEAGDFPSACAMAEKALAVDPLDAATRSFLADQLYGAGQIEPALAHTRILAVHYAERHLYDLAEHEYRRIVAHEPDNAAVWQKIIEMIEALGEQEEHISDYLLAADLMARRGLLDQAAQLYGQVVQQTPENLDARRALIEIYLQMSATNEAVAACLELADRLAAQGQTEEALAVFRRVLSLQPDHARAAEAVRRLSRSPSRTSGITRTRARAKVESSEEIALREAIADYGRILRANPNTPLVRAQMADLLFQVGEVKEAVREWDGAATQFSDGGDYQQVVALCEKILEADPNHAQARERLSHAHLWRDSMDALDSAIRSVKDER